MAKRLTKRERLSRSIAGRPVDRLPVALWRHFFVEETSRAGLVEAMVRWQETYDWDFLKINPRACYHVQDWGNQYEFSGGEHVKPSLVRNTVGAGVSREGMSGFVQASFIDGVTPRPVDDGFGYGLQAVTRQGASAVVLDIQACRIQEATIAGILYYEADGTLGSSVVRGGEYSVVINGGNLDILETNDLTGSTQGAPIQMPAEPYPTPPPSTPTNVF